MSAQVSVRIRRIDDHANAGAFVAAWLTAELGRDRRVVLLRSGQEVVEFGVEIRDHELVLKAIAALLEEPRFVGWEVCRR